MILQRFAVALCVACSCLLAAPDDVATQRPALPGDLLCSGEKPSDLRCPWRKRSATLLPSFTKTTTPPTTHHPNTTHHPTTLPANHTTMPTNHTTMPANHTTMPTNHTTMPTNHTTMPANHTTMPANHTTYQPTNHTTPFHTVAPMNHTTPPHPTNRTTPFVIPTAPWPTDTPLVPVGNYMVQNGSSTCLRLLAGLQIQVRYTNKAQQLHWGTFAVQPSNTNTSGACSSTAASLELRFPEGFLIFLFRKNETKGTSYLSRVQAKLTFQFPQARAEVCGAQHYSILVPILVFVVIAALVLIVLVAYAVGRRRSRVGYETL
ncbi:macrosialin isoform X2 [Paroedura picta]|uniref:macrosialin isoform X2 n=1 Tax=Paroedura picta TaxID=143630 RepID=UPI0040573055